jgi:hypothetical protein
MTRTNVEHWASKLNVTKVPGAFFRSLFASLAVVLTVDCTESRVIDTLCPRPLTLIILSRR